MAKKRSLDRQVIRSVLRERLGKDLFRVTFIEKPQGTCITITLKLKGFHRVRLVFSGFITKHEVLYSALPVKDHSHLIGENLASLPAHILKIQSNPHPSFPQTEIVA